MAIVLLGPPGSGKGTQAALLCERLGVPHISTGELLRQAVREGSELGRRAQRFMDAGELVPDELVLDLIEQRLGLDDVRHGYILDGYPRNLAQAEALDQVLARVGLPVRCALAIEVDENEIIGRLARRATEEGRSDDSTAVVRNRLKVYSEQTAPVSDYYRQRKLLHTVDGMGSVEAVNERLYRALPDGST